MPIVISQSLALQQSDFVSPWSPVIGWRTKVVADQLAATSSVENFPVSNLATPSTAEEWVATSTDEQFLTLTLTDPDEIDYVALARHNIGTGLITASVQGFIEDAWEDLTDSILPANDETILFRFPRQSLAQIRVRLQPGSVPARLANLLIGRLTIAPPNIQLGFTPLPFGRVVDVGSDESESGNFLGRIVYSEFRESPVSFVNLDPEWYRAEFDPFLKAAATRPFVFAWDPLHYPNEVGFAYIKPGTNPQPKIQDGHGRMQIELQMRGIV